MDERATGKSVTGQLQLFPPQTQPSRLKMVGLVENEEDARL